MEKVDSCSPRPISFDAARQEAETHQKEMLHKTKAIQFFGRTIPIILQNENGPCPLLAICNVLSLKNSLNLSPDVAEVSQEKLLSLVAERLIDSNSNIDNKDADYVENQQQNIADAIDLLPRLTTGIDVNIRFRRIDDFEFTPECTLFDLLDIPLYHGWIVDTQDSETADAIGSKSYNTLMGELVSLETEAMEREQDKNLEEDDVDFVAATTAALGVPSPSLSRSQSFTDSPQRVKKGDVEEEAELLRILKLSEAEVPTESAHVGKILIHSETVEKNFDETVETEALTFDDTYALSNPSEDSKIWALVSDDSNALRNLDVDKRNPDSFTREDVCSLPETDTDKNHIEQTCKESKSSCKSTVADSGCDLQIQNEKPVSSGEDPPSSCEFTSTSDQGEQRHLKNDKPEIFTSSVDASEPIYEGEECILESRPVIYENQEPVYEGEVVLAEQLDKVCTNDGDSEDRISFTQGAVIRKFMKDNASQLTVYGLFCLQAKVKERELCVFFRNNHFNTMFKYEGQLYILATDQGFINQPDLVWEKLNEVNGDTMYVMANFKDFIMDDHSDGTWDEHNALSRTADYIASFDGVAQSGSGSTCDLQLAIALQQQEFEQQQPQRNMPVIGPQVSHNSDDKHEGTSSSAKHDSGLKEKCIVM